MLNKLKQKLKNRKPMEPKRKALVKGLVFGFLAGGLATITAVGIVGCSMTQGDSKQPQSRQLVGPQRREALSAEDYVGKTYIFKNPFPGTLQGVPIKFQCEISEATASGWFGERTVFYGFRFNGSSAYIYTSSSNYNTAFRTSSGWADCVNNTAPTFKILTAPTNDVTGTEFTTFINDYVEEVVTEVSSSSEETSSLPSATSRAEGGTVTFNDRNPFSAWVVNPKSLDRATSFDSGAPWLLYTGSPTDDDSNHSTIATKYELYDVGAFHVYGNDGVTFDKIGITTQNLSADNVLTLDGETATQVSAAMYEKGAFRVTGIKYVNSVSNNSVDVYKEAWSVVDMNGNSVYALSGGRWLNEGFRTIVLDDVDGSLTINGYQASVGWWLENNALASSDAVATMVLGNSSTGVFGLIASAFGCWTSVFGLAIIPGLTIGTLIFVPLVVMIIVAIVKLLAK